MGGVNGDREEEKKRETQALILFAAVSLIVFLFYSISPRPTLLQPRFHSVKLCSENPTGQFCKYGSWQCIMKGWHISRTYQMVASPRALSDIVPSPPYPHYCLPRTISLSFSCINSGWSQEHWQPIRGGGAYFATSRVKRGGVCEGQQEKCGPTCH